MGHPRDYDTAKIAVLEFAPACDITACYRDAAAGIRCRFCGDIRSLLCLRHAEAWKSADRPARCGACNAAAARYAALYAIVPLGAFLIGGAR